NTSGATLLHLAAEAGLANMVNELINVYHLDKDARDYHGYTPLHIAAVHNQLLVIFDLIMKHKVNKNLRTKQGLTPFDFVQNKKDFNLASLLKPNSSRKKPLSK
ncbi:MAG: ankyrin repeat domain-containing protein, partial [Bacteroidota bacterium]